MNKKEINYNDISNLPILTCDKILSKLRPCKNCPWVDCKNRIIVGIDNGNI